MEDNRAAEQKKLSASFQQQQNSILFAVTNFSTITITLLLILYRVLIGFQPHSGQNNHHGAKQAYGGDYEAQRHWMELTYHLPLHEWYHYDLEYWGLDYPPLTAYVSYVCGYLSHSLVGPETVALFTSRGYEEEIRHKPFMRATVLGLDVLLYFTAIDAWCRRRRNQQQPQELDLFSFVFALMQPALVLIDHGHFQYNTTALGLSLWSFYWITQLATRAVLLGAIAFCMALSFKQMTLYYAPVVGCYLLGRCCAHRKSFLRSFLLLGGTVLLTFLLLWGPIVFSATPSDPWRELKQVLIRIFPVQRGLFEGKVANVWCALSIRPFRIRQRLSAANQFRASLGLTALLMSPACVQVFRLGQRHPIGRSTAASTQSQRDQERVLLWATSACAMAFFLASFQVHEKSLLLATAPLSLLWNEAPILAEYFSFISMWTLWPLLVIDRLQTAYVAIGIIFVSVLQISAEFDLTPKRPSQMAVWFCRMAYILMLLLHVMEFWVLPPAHWPDLFPVLWSVTGCGLIGVAYLWTVYRLLSSLHIERYNSSLESIKDKTL
jgi:alpha-1,3-glucosyltransferase